MVDAVEKLASRLGSQHRRLPSRHNMPGFAHGIGWIEGQKAAGSEPGRQYGLW